MKRLIPVPSQESMPSEIAAELTALADVLDTQFDGWIDDAFGIEKLKDPARMPSSCLDEAGYELSADFQPGDDDRVKRAKLVSATRHNTMRGLWEDSVKPVVEARSGVTASLVNFYGADDFILSGDTWADDTYWSGLSGDDADLLYGIRLVGGASDYADPEEVVTGIFAIDCGRADMTAAEISALVVDLLDLIPAYFQAYLGYVTAGDFHAYADGRIN